MVENGSITVGPYIPAFLDQVSRLPQGFHQVTDTDGKLRSGSPSRRMGQFDCVFLAVDVKDQDRLCMVGPHVLCFRGSPFHNQRL